MSLTYGFCLGPEDTLHDSAEFSDAFRSLIGDGVCEYGTGFAITLRTGFGIYVGTGFALAGGRWLKNDERYSLTFSPSNDNQDRYDAVAVTADYESRKVSLRILENVDIEAIKADPSIIRNDERYSILLYAFHIHRGATTLMERDIIDLRDDLSVCGRISQIGNISTKALKAYQFLNGGLDEEVARIIGLADLAVEKGQEAVEELEKAIRRKTGNGIGDLITSAEPPLPGREWLLCVGGSIPSYAGYQELSALLNGVLPNTQPDDARFSTYIYGGPPW